MQLRRIGASLVQMRAVDRSLSCCAFCTFSEVAQPARRWLELTETRNARRQRLSRRYRNLLIYLKISSATTSVFRTLAREGSEIRLNPQHAWRSAMSEKQTPELSINLQGLQVG